MQEEPATSEQATTVATDTEASSGRTQSVVRNTLYLTIGNAATIPVAMAANSLLGRFLGAEEFGHLYLASTLCGFAILALEWGQAGALPALVARDRSRAAAYLGTSLAWRTGMGVLVMLALWLVCKATGYSRELTSVVLLSFVIYIVNSCTAGFKDTVRGFERTDIPALAHVGNQFLNLLVLVPVLLLGGRVHAALAGNLLASSTTLLVLGRAVSALRVGRLRYERGALSELFSIGSSFAFFDLSLALPPYINASFMEKSCPPEVIGWYAVAQRLVGLVIFPAAALNGALYPTLARLQVEDQDELTRVASNAIYGASLLALPAAVGCGVFAEIGVAIFGTKSFAGATVVLQVLSLFVLLVYVSMPIGATLMSGGKRRAWTIVQGGGVLLCFVGSPLLLPYFQRTTGNGAIGAAVLLVLGEILVVGAGVWLSERAVFSKELLKSLGLVAVAGVAMVLVAVLLKPVSMLIAVPASLLAYAWVGYKTGAIRPSVVDQVRGFVARKFARS